MAGMFHMSGKTLPKNREGKTDWNWASYFALKKQKLQEQFNETSQVNANLDQASREIFRGVGIFVNGYTNPTAIELKSLMHRHGGTFFDYPNEDITHIIASQLARSKALALRNKLVVKPEWIMDCIKEKRILSTDKYLVIRLDKNQHKLTFLPRNSPSVKIDPKTPRSALKRKSSHFTLQKIEAPKILEPSLSKKINVPNQREYKCFKQKIAEFELPNHVNKSQSRDDLELDKVKHILSDWIFWTTRHTNAIDQEDLEIFTGYMFYLLNHRRQLEKLSLILKVLKRLIQTNGSSEWIEIYKDLCGAIQTDFYVEFDSTIKLD